MNAQFANGAQGRSPHSLLRRASAIAFAIVPVSIGTVAYSAVDAAAQTKSQATSNTALVVSDGCTGPNIRNFNPYLDAYNTGTSDIYEPLLMWNSTTGAVSPWLATSWKWSSDDKSLTLDLHTANWSNGQPFTSADVVFTFQLLQKYPGLNGSGVTFSSVTASGPHQVTFTFAAPAYWEFSQLTSALIVPESVWKTVSNPTTFTNPNPIGTGPFELSSWSSQYVFLKANPTYWGTKPKVTTVEFPALTGSTACENALETGELQWTNLSFPNYKQLFIDRSPKENFATYPAYGDEGLFPNLTKYPLSLLPLRQAMSLVIDRKLLSVEGESGVQPPALSPTGLLPQNSPYYAPAFKNLSYQVNVAKARKILLAAGFKFEGNGQLLSPKGSPVDLTLIDESAASDFMTDGSIIVSDLKSIGVKATLDGVSFPLAQSDFSTGNFQLGFYWESETTVGPSGSYSLLSNILNSSYLAPVGKSSLADYERWSDPATQKYFAAYQAATSQSQRLDAVWNLENIMVTQLPMIPLLHNVWDDVWTSRDFTGWPTGSDPYANPNILFSQSEVVMLHLRPRS